MFQRCLKTIGDARFIAVNSIARLNLQNFSFYRLYQIYLYLVWDSAKNLKRRSSQVYYILASELISCSSNYRLCFFVFLLFDFLKHKKNLILPLWPRPLLVSPTYLFFVLIHILIFSKKKILQ